MKKFVLHLLVLSHSYAVPSLKRVCEHFLEQGWLTKESVMDVLQLARNSDAPHLALVFLRMVVRDFKCISTTEAWKVMKRCNPSLEQELLESLIQDDIVLKDSPNTFSSIDNYKSIFWALRLHWRIFFKAFWVNIVSVWQPMENMIMVRWTVHGIPRIPWESLSSFDGTSYHKIDKDVKIYEQKVHNIAPGSDV